MLCNMYYISFVVGGKSEMGLSKIITELFKEMIDSLIMKQEILLYNDVIFDLPTYIIILYR